MQITDPFDGFTTAELHAEITRRLDAEEAETRRAAGLMYQRTRLAGAVSSARLDLTLADDEHARRSRAHAGLLALNMNVRPDDVRNAEIAVEQANRARTDAKDRFIEAERALDTFERTSA